jgi:hypothetical protein
LLFRHNVSLVIAAFCLWSLDGAVIVFNVIVADAKTIKTQPSEHHNIRNLNEVVFCLTTEYQQELFIHLERR